MPLYSDSNFYYTSGGGTGGSPYYTPGLYGSSSSASSSYAPYTATYSRSMTGSYVMPLSTPRSPTYTSSALSSRYQPKLSTITESPLIGSSRHTTLMPLTRIQSPKYSTYTAPTTTAPKYIPARPININTADIDVSSSRYHHTLKRYQPSSEEEQKKGNSQISPKSSINAEHRDTTEKNDTAAAGESGSRQARTTIKRNRAVVRLSTVRSRSKDRNKVNETVAEPDEKRFRDLPRPPEENLSWRQKLAQDLAAIPTYPLKKTPGELLRERYLIQEAKNDELSTPGARHTSHLDTVTNVMEEPATIDKVVVELDPVDHTIRRLSIPNCPTFHDICEDISSDKIDDDLNAGVLRRRASLIQEQEQELFTQLQESASETFQMLPLDRSSNSQESSTDDSSSKTKHPSKKTKKRHKITAIVDVENTPLITVEEEIDTPKHNHETVKPKFTFNVESVEEHHEVHKILKLPKKKSVRKSLKAKKKSAATLPEGFVPAIPKPQSSPKAKDNKPKTFITTAEIFTFSQQSVEESKAEELQKEQSIDEPDISVTLKSPTKIVKQNNVLEEIKPKLVKQEAVVVELSQQASSDSKAPKETSENVAIIKPKTNAEETLTSEISKPTAFEKITSPTPIFKDSEETTSSLKLKDSKTTVNIKDSQTTTTTPKVKDSEKAPITPKIKDSEKAPTTPKVKEIEKTPTTPKVKEVEKTPSTPKVKDSEKAPTTPKIKHEEKTPTSLVTLNEPLLKSKESDKDVVIEPKPLETKKATTPILKTSISIELSSPTENDKTKSVLTPTMSKPPLIKNKAVEDSKDKQTASPPKTNAKQMALKSAVSLDTPTSTKITTKILEKTQSLNNEEPKIAPSKPIEKKIQKSESGEDFWSQIGTRESIYMTNRKNNLLGSQWSKQEDLSELPGENDDINDISPNTVTVTTVIDKTLSQTKPQTTDTKIESSKLELKLPTTKCNDKVEAAPAKVKSPTQKTETSEELTESKTAKTGTTASSTPVTTKKATTTTTKAAEQSKTTTPTITTTTTTKASAEKAPAAATTITATTTKISSGQEAKSPEQQQATNSATTTAAAKIKSSNNTAEQPNSPSTPTAAKTCETKQTTELATPTVATKLPNATIPTTKTTAKTTIELTKQPPNAAAGTKQTETKTPKLTEAKKKVQTDPKSTDTTSNKNASNTCTLDATAANKTKATGGVDKKTAAKKTSPTAAKKTSPTINADHFVTIAPPKTSTAAGSGPTSPTKNKNTSPTTKPTNAAAKQKTQTSSPKVNDSPLNTKATAASTATATVGATTTTAATSTTTAVSTATTATTASGTENVLAKFATVSNLAQCLQDVDGDLDDYIPSSAENSDDDSSYDYSSPDGCENLSASMKKKLKQRRKKEKQAAEPARFDPQKKVKITIDATNKCYTKEQAPRYPLVATPRPLWKREQINYNGDSDDSDSDASGSTEETTEESDEYTSSSEYEDDLRPTGGANSDASATSGNKENSAIIRLSTCSNDSGFEGGTAPSSPKKMLGARELRESPSTPPSLNPAYKIEPNEEHDETSYTYSQFQKSGRFTAPATVIPRFKNYTVDDFHFLAVLGKGSFGKVLLAELRDTTYYYAVKCLKKDVVLEDDDVDSTLIERKVLALGTKHPYLCHLFCTFQTESHLFFVMEYLNGGDLMFHIQESGRFTEERARFYGAEIISGLKFLHKKGIIYRDLKLDNVLLDYEGHVRIADFGMCKLQIYLDKTADSFCGTPDYMAPEIIKGEKYNQNVDWWSFGVLLYEMLIGQSPFSGCDEDELFWSICNEVPWFPVYITEEATSILKGLLEKDYTKRVGSQYSPAGDIAEHIFFQPIDWNLLDKRQLEPPFRPQVKHPLDTQYFDRVFTRERVRLTPIDKEILQSMDQKQFHGFTYTNPHITLD